MKRTTVKALSALLALVLLLSVLPVAAFATEHIHNYNVTTHIDYEFYSDFEHTKIETHVHLCDCGHSFLENHRENGDHVALFGSGEVLGSCLGEDGRTITTYRFMCKICAFDFCREVVS